MKDFTKFLFFTITLITLSFDAKATHVSGGDFSYVCIGPNQYLITMNLYNDCFSSVSMPTSPSISFSNSCGVANPPNLSLTLQNPGGTEISQLCPPQQSQSACNGGPLPGMATYTYTAVVTLPANCEYFMNYNLCCRNCAINLATCSGTNGPNFHLQSSIDNTNNNCNNSPQFTSQPIPYVCANQPVAYNFGAIEPDGDSLVFSLVSALQQTTTNVTYNPGFSGAAPIPGATITPNTGQLSFTPTQVGFFVFVIKVEEYDANGNFLGFVTRDIQFVVQNCTNNGIDINSGGITDITGSADTTDAFSVTMCEGDNFTFTVEFNDPDLNDVLTYTSNISSVLPGATISTNPASTGNPLILNVTWTAPSGSSGLNNFFTITVNDNACPVPSELTVIYDINVEEATLASVTWPAICGTQTSELQATGGTIFHWFDTNGDTIPVDSTFSCNPCANPTVKPNVSTTYIVVSNLSLGCINTDTVTVDVVFPYDLSFDTVGTLCSVDEPVILQIATPNLVGIGTFSGPGITNPNAGVFNPQFANDGINTIYFTANLPDGCGGVDSLDIDVINVPDPGIISSGTICNDEPDTLLVPLNSGGTWSTTPNPNAIDANTGLFNPSLAASGNNTIRYVLDVLGCRDSSQSTIVVLPRANATITSSVDTLCLNDPNTQITVAQTGGIWSASPVANAINNAGTFRPNNAGAGTHTLTYTLGGVCGASDTRTIEVIPPPQVDITGESELCLGDDPITLTASLTGGQWSSAPVLGAINQSTGVFNPANAGAGNHVVTYDYPFGNCSAMPTFNITVKPTPNLPILQIPSAPCEGESYDILIANASGGAQIVWYEDADLTVVLDSSDTYLYTGTSETTLYVTQIFNGCESSAAQANLVFNPIPNVSFVADPEFGIAPLNVSFNNTSDSTVTIFEWEYDGQVFSIDENPAEIFMESGSYLVTLFGEDENGCINSFQSTIIVDLIVPNVFTPNGDGQNDKFFDLSAFGITFTDFEGKIFNRWGNVVYEWTDNQGWDGRNNSGSEVAAGTYFYIMTAIDPSGEPFKKEGTITLMK